MKKIALWLLIAVIAGAVLYEVIEWLQYRERQNVSVSRSPSAASLENPLLMASRFLARRGLTTRDEPSLHGVAGRLGPHDTLVAMRADASLPAREQRALLHWVDAGGVLITSFSTQKSGHRPSPDDDGEEDSGNPLLASLQISAVEDSKQEGPYLIRPPALGYQLTVTTWQEQALQPSTSVKPDWTDAGGHFLLAYKRGSGWIVVLGSSRLFDQHALLQRDNAQLLWELARINPGKAWLVRPGAPDQWYARLWATWPQALITLAVLILLWVWHCGVRFGPLLPVHGSQRRALLEHIRASARWTWRRNGEAQLLQAARRATRALLERRMPEWTQLPPDELTRRLAKRYDMPQTELDAALNRPVTRHPGAFAAAVATLQTLRNKL
ncbi:hypothetical protein SAMN02745857_02703 [Andreprevotia lacus DSM 23236]|jgi:hypothetical protein|uniref:DUF4350 domain-containing protein n=1 Tax=Andreprevotia lacus DSM 23236 TaxID=1121001 RepID=A0A1W1XU99_9NEIS|nr:DUF4350 domain-containing protein [Andreprevotia lacus]SMC27078.1 hypothetical protein SAMN02745857_02703 [Andreprevotia lacus DSM 23236]